MDDEVGKSSKTYTEIFDEALPYYLSIGMTYELFWYGDCTAVKAYHKAHEIALDERNFMAWNQGYYIYQAIGALTPILNPLSKKKKPEEYLKEPRAITQRAEHKKELEKGKQTANFLLAWAQAIKSKGIDNG